MTEAIESNADATGLNVGQIVRFAEGSTAIMRITSFSAAGGRVRVYGEHILGGPVGADLEQIAEATGIDIALWKKVKRRGRRKEGWNTDAAEFAKAIGEFEAALPGFWWSAGQCSVGAHASCAVDGNGCQADLLKGVSAGEPLDSGFHCDTDGGSPADALRDVMRQAVAYLEAHKSAD